MFADGVRRPENLKGRLNIDGGMNLFALHLVYMRRGNGPRNGSL